MFDSLDVCKTLEDYFARFRRLALMDFVVAFDVLGKVVVQVHAVKVLRPYFKPPAAVAAREDLVVTLGVCVLFIWLCDCALLLLFSSRVREASTGTPFTKTAFSTASSEGREFSLRSLYWDLPSTWPGSSWSCR